MYLGDARDTALDSTKEAEFLATWHILSEGCTKAGTPLIMQINRPGRQSRLGRRNPRLGRVGTPREMSQADITTVIQQFVDCSRLACAAGLQGVQIRAAHGYLLAEFLSPKTNQRTDRYGGSAEGRAQIVTEIVRGIREAVPATFCVGIRLNSVYHQSRETLAACVKQLKMIVAAGIDFVEISGGTYEDPQMMQAAAEPQKEKSSRTLAREAFFLKFASAIRHEIPDVPLLVTGGFRSRRGLAAAINDNACDLVGLGRPAVLHPDLPKSVLLNDKVPDDEAVFPTKLIQPPWFMKRSGKWYSKHIQEIGRQASVASA
ncbi:hypothetical protein BDW66DRAFT_167530 [Aspergillus desertorum]